MTVSSAINKSGPYSGNSVTTVFQYGFKIQEDADLEVIHTDTDEVETVLTLSTDYTVSGAGSESGGNVTYPVTGDPLPSGEKLTIRRKLSFVQETDITNQGGFYPQVLEDALDRAIMGLQQVSEEVDRSYKVSISSGDSGDDVMTTIQANATAAAASETAAAASESNAATSESNASTSETNAAASETKAGKWADEDEDVEVETGKYSAKHWSAKAQASNEPKVKITGKGHGKFKSPKTR